MKKATTKKKTTSKATPSAILKEIAKKKASGASASEINKLKKKYMDSIVYK